jgi:hypothetical protein
MCKVLRLGCFIYKVMILKIFFGLGPELEIDQVFQPPTTPSPPNLARKDKDGRKLGRNGSVELALTLLHIVPNGC